MPRPRTWTDEQLAKAVPGSASWAEVTERLGLSIHGKNYRRLLGHAMRLGIDTSHLKSQAKAVPIHSPEAGSGDLSWLTREQLAAVVDDSTSLAEVARKLGLPGRGRTYERLQSAAERLGVDLGDLPGQAWSRHPVPALQVPFAREFDVMNLHKVGAAAAMAWFLSRGYMVSLPVETTTYDLVVESDEGLKRVQVKTSRSGKTVGITKTQYGGSPARPSTGKYGSRPYWKGEVDLFFVYAGDGAMYLIPLEAVFGMTCLSLPKYSNYRLPAGEAPREGAAGLVSRP